MGRQCAIIKTRREYGAVPCKLNNVTNEKHQKDGCLKSFVKGAWKDNVKFL